MSLKGAKLIDFTGSASGFESHKSFDDAVINSLRMEVGENPTLVVIDRAVSMTVAEPHLVTDQINLTGSNPLCGPNAPCGERFPVVSGIYETEVGIAELKNLRKGVAGGLKDGVVLSSEELEKLRPLGMDFYCYNLIPTMLVAAHAGYKVVALVVPDGQKLDENICKRLLGA